MHPLLCLKAHDAQLFTNTQSTDLHNNQYDGTVRMQETYEEPAILRNNRSKDLPPLTNNHEPSPHSAQTPTLLPPPLIPMQQMVMTNQGKVVFKDITTASSYGHTSDNDEMSHIASWSVSSRRFHHQDIENNSFINDQNSLQHFPRRRLDTGGYSQMTLDKVEENKISDWELVQRAVQDNATKPEERNISSGSWKVPAVKAIFLRLWNSIRFPFKKTIYAVDDFKSTSTFAVVTFTSRQAAVAARHCLADGRGAGRWVPVEDIPVPPLADASVCDFCDCRGCCRPVTLTINPKQQFIRRNLTIFMLAVIYIFYTLPLTFASALIAPEKLENLIPGIREAAKENLLLNNLLSGILPAVFYSIFFALCPVMFKSISNFGSNAVSVNQAEFIALKVNFVKNLFLLIILFFVLTHFLQNPTFKIVLLVVHADHCVFRNIIDHYGFKYL